MTCLHTINGSPSSTLLASCVAVISEGDGILFIEDGVYHCSNSASLAAITEDIDLYGLREDMLARGKVISCSDKVESIDMPQFITLCCQYDKVISWF